MQYKHSYVVLNDKKGNVYLDHQQKNFSVLTCSNTGISSEKTVQSKTTKVSLASISVESFNPYTDFSVSS